MDTLFDELWSTKDCHICKLVTTFKVACIHWRRDNTVRREREREEGVIGTDRENRDRGGKREKKMNWAGEKVREIAKRKHEGEGFSIMEKILAPGKETG